MGRTGHSLFAFVAPIAVAAVALGSCATIPAQGDWETLAGSLPRSMSIEIAPSGGAVFNFRIRGEELEGATLKGDATRTQDGWDLEVMAMDWFGNWTEGWTQASFVAEGQLAIRPEGKSWKLVVESAPKLENPTSASIRLFGDYFTGETALTLFSHRWDRILAVDNLLRGKFPDAWFDYSSPGRMPAFLGPLGRRRANFQESVRSFLFPELYGYSAEGRPAGTHPISRAESIDWDIDYTRANFPENLQAIRDSGTMLRDFEESPGLWRLAFVWDDFWERKIGQALFVERSDRAKAK